MNRNSAPCPDCGKEFGSEKALSQHSEVKHAGRPRQLRMGSGRKRMRDWSLLIVVATIAAASWYVFVPPLKQLPPITISGHIEASPPSHILKEPMPPNIQKHMLEHADGGGSPGVVINYNCGDYSCEDGLVEKLEAFALSYNNVYAAPFPGMGAKIALTRSGKIETLDAYDEAAIRKFITGA